MKRILIIQTAFLGDVILTIPLLSAIKKKTENCFLSVLLIPEVKEILTGHPAVDELIVYDKKGKDKSFPGFLKLVKRIRKKKFDIVILPHRSFRSALLAWLSKIPVRVGFDRSQGKIFLNNIVNYDKNKHDLERNLDLGVLLGVNIFNPEIYLPIEKDEREDASKILKKCGFGENDLLIGINPGSVWPTKRWWPQRYAKLLNLLVEEGYKPIIFGSKKDISVVDRIINDISSETGRNIANLAGKTSLKQLSALISKCRIFVTNDSASMHIAVAHKVPVIALFGPTTPQLGFYPYGENNLVIEKKMACRPCGLHGGYKCRLKTHECMKEIKVKEVFEAVQQKLTKMENEQKQI